MPPPLRLAVLVSGRGSNLAALLAAHARGELDVEPVLVASDRPGCAALAIARAAGVPVAALPPREFASRAAFDRALFGRVADAAPDLLVLAGFMRILDAEVVASAPWPMINVHPSLLPRHPGLDTHARALAAGDAEHGASVHQVIPQLDAGPVLAQARIPVHGTDTPETLAARLLPLEHALLVGVVGLIADGRLRLSQAGIQFDGATLAAPLVLEIPDDGDAKAARLRAPGDRPAAGNGPR
ncbi:MAG: phosphoribosylglycinamide formyltransferase [Xanthomonadales bacterium]|nr:phosphoribosylglycinamide formyltransferase [Xanthomonadales bacterium]